MSKRKRRPYRSLQDWMERTRTNQTRLAELVGMTQSHLSYILMGARRCSIENALKLSDLTGVPVQKLVEWGRRDSPSTSERSFKSDSQKSA